VYLTSKKYLRCVSVIQSIFLIFRFSEEGAATWDYFTKSKMAAFSKMTGNDQLIVPIKSVPACKRDFDSFNQTLEKAKVSIKSESTSTSSTIKHECWLRLEKMRAQEELLCFHGDKETCEDSERIVFFDDVSFVLFTVNNEESLFQILLTYLLMLGLPIPLSRYSKVLLRRFKKFFKVIESNGKHPCYCHSTCFCDFILCADSTVFTATGFAHRVPLLRRILSQAIHRFVDERIVQSISAVWFHFESILFRFSFEDVASDLNKKYWKEMRKFLKNLLRMKANRSCVELWDMYALYEWHLGNVVDAEKVFVTAAQLTLSTSHHQQNFSTLR